MVPSDTFTPVKVRRIVEEHDRVWRNKRAEIGLTNAILLTQFWDWWIGQGARGAGAKYARNGTEIEVNRLWKEVSIYKAALCPSSDRVICGPDPLGGGDSKCGTVAMSAWWKKRDTRRRILSGIEMALAFPGSAFKVGYDPGSSSPIDRTWLRVIPPWEVVLDRNVSDVADERFRGHIYFATKADLVKRYPKLRGLELIGVRRDDFLSGDDKAPATPIPADASDVDADFVRVFEFYNLVDSAIGKGGDEYAGRLEVHLLDQGTLSDTPVLSKPFPMASKAGRPLPSLEPLIFAHELGYPLRPIAPVARLLPQQVEMNLLRTMMMQMVRRDARKGISRKGAFNAAELAKLLDGQDMNFAETDDVGHRLSDLVYMLPHAPLSSDFKTHMSIVDADFRTQAASPPAAHGEVTKATAYEVQTVQLYSDSDVKFHGLLVLDTVERVLPLAQHAIIGAMRDGGDSEGGVEVGKPVDGGAKPTDAPKKPPAPSSFTMKDRDEVIEITVESLDADFEFTLVEGARTPLTDEAMLQFLTGAGSDIYQKLWTAVQGGDLLAERIMAHLAEVGDLPKDMHPDEMLAALEKKKKEAGAKPPAAPPDVAAAMSAPEVDAAPDPRAPVHAALVGVMQALAAVAGLGDEAKAAVLPAGQAVASAIEALKSGTDPGPAILAAQDALSAAPELPPEANAPLDSARAGLAALAPSPGGVQAAPEVPVNA